MQNIYLRFTKADRLAAYASIDRAFGKGTSNLQNVFIEEERAMYGINHT
jgi:hypothetical protein